MRDPFTEIVFASALQGILSRTTGELPPPNTVARLACDYAEAFMLEIETRAELEHMGTRTPPVRSGYRAP